MGLVKEIEEELKQKNNHVEAIEDILIRDSVLDHKEAPGVDEFEEVGPGELRKKVEIDLGGKYAGKPISRQRFAKSALQADSDFQKTLKLLVSDEDDDEEPIDDEIVDANDASDDEQGAESDGEVSLSQDGSEDDEDLSQEGSEELSLDDSDNEGDEFDDDVNLADYADQPEAPVEKSGIEIFSAKAKDVDADVSKGNAIKNQLSIWESLLECRIKLQPCLIATNKLYQKDNLLEFKSQLSKADEGVVSKTYSSLGEMMKTLLELQETLGTLSSEYRKYKIDKSSKTKKQSKTDDEDDESIASSEASGKEEESSDESDNDQPVKRRKLNPSTNLIKDIYDEFKPFGEASISKWYEKTRVASGKISSADFSAFDQSPLKQIDQILFDKERLIRKTQMLRSSYDVLGKTTVPEVQTEAEPEDPDVPKPKAKVQHEYDEEVFDDDDFYHKLLRDFIERKSADVTDPHKHGRQWLELQQMRSKMKRKVDTRASKGRKLRYTVHNKLVSFMAPIPSNQWTQHAQDNLYNSLFGKATGKT